MVALADVLLKFGFDTGFIVFLVKFYLGNDQGPGHLYKCESCPVNVRCLIRVPATSEDDNVLNATLLFGDVSCSTLGMSGMPHFLF